MRYYTTSILPFLKCVKKRSIDMEEIVIKEILKSCNWYEKIFVKMFKKKIYKIYQEGAKYGFSIVRK